MNKSIIASCIPAEAGIEMRLNRIPGRASYASLPE